MDTEAIFNLVVCLLGVAILLIHIVDLSIKPHKRNDEKNLLVFFIFTAFHFALYLSFIVIQAFFTSDALIMGFYTSFYVANNVEVLLLFIYAISYVAMKKDIKKTLTTINISIFLVFIVMDIINIFTHMFFFAQEGIYYRSSLMIISQIYQFIGFGMVFVITVFNKKLSITGRIAFSLYCLLPLVGIVIQNAIPRYAIGYLSILISIEILFLFANMKKNIDLANEEKRNKEAEIKIMMSQIQPHFIYNTLASISTLIKIDPDKAEKALDDFTEYLRTNLSSLTETGLISFEDELKHILTYISLEKMRFNDRLNVKFDIRVKDFYLPPLTIQPLVENAIKHGILQNIEGGCIEINTYEENKAYVVEVIDNGVGFDTNNIGIWDNNHIGINNVKTRLNGMCAGTLEITSVIDRGTKVVVTISK